MAIDAAFQTASERLELSVNAVATIARGCPLRTAFSLLNALQYDEERYGDVIARTLDTLATISDEPIKWEHGRGLSGVVRSPDAVYPHCWSSAHEAALGISRMALDFFLQPLGLTAHRRLPKEREALFRELLEERRRKSLAMTLEEVADWQVRIRRERARMLAKPLGKPMGEAANPIVPVKLLTSWREITDALGLRHDDQGKVKRLNERYNGPIPKPTKGGQPVVRTDALLEWWDGLAAKEQELANERESARLSGEAQHNYGRDGIIAPEIGGSVKKRRRDSKR